MKVIFVLALVFELLLPLAEGYKHGLRHSPPRAPLRKSGGSSGVARHAAQRTTHNATFSLAADLERRSFVGLLPRQFECEPGFYLCPNLECCEDGEVCIATGCCLLGEEACGEDDCYDPATETCCEDGGSCTLPDVCVGGGRCCPEGQEACGEDSCYNPETEVCCSDTSTTCEEGYVCVEDDFCCLSQFPERCGTEWCYNPETGVCCTDEENTGGWACKTGFECCNLSAGCYDADTEICCEGGACLEGQTCCTEECCTDIATCGEDGFCTATESGSITESVSETFISEPTVTETRITEPTNTETGTGTETETSPTKTATSTKTTQTITTPKVSSTTTSRSHTSTSSTSACSVKNQQRAAPLSTFTIKYEEKMTVLPVVQTSPGAPKSTTVCLDNREILDNICKGIHQYSGCKSNQIQLTYGPGLNAINRPKVCPSGSCSNWNEPCGNSSNQNEMCNPYYNIMNGAPGLVKQNLRMSCDEFPPASTLQGGTKGTTIGTGITACVPGWQNDRQGTQLLGVYYYWRREQKLTPPPEYVDYILEVTGWSCDTNEPTNPPTNCKSLSRRDDLGGASVSPGDFDFFPNVTGDGQNGLMLILGDVDAGIYTYNLTIHSGTFPTVVALDSNGIPIYEATDGLSAGSHTISFELGYSDGGVSLWALTTDTDASISYNITSQPLPSNATETCTTTTAKKSTSTEPCTTSSSTSTELCSTTTENRLPPPYSATSSEVTSTVTVKSTTPVPSSISGTPESTESTGSTSLSLSIGAVSTGVVSMPGTTGSTAPPAGSNTTLLPLPVATGSSHYIESITVFGMVLLGLTTFALL